MNLVISTANRDSDSAVRGFHESEDDGGENANPNTLNSIYGNGSASADAVADTKKPNILTRMLAPKDDKGSAKKRGPFSNPMRRALSKNNDLPLANADSKNSEIVNDAKPVSPSKRVRDYTGASDADEKIAKQKSFPRETEYDSDHDDISYGFIYDTSDYKDEVADPQYINKLNPRHSLPRESSKSTSIARQEEADTLTEETKSEAGSISSSGSFTLGCNSNDVQRETSLATTPASKDNKCLDKCLVRRRRESIAGKVYPTYELYDNSGKLLIVAQKMRNSGLVKTYSNYHFFDMSRGSASTIHTKKSGNYLGKLRCKDSSRCDYVLLNHHENPTEVAAVSFDKVSILEAFTDVTPRSMRVVLPDPASKPHLRPASSAAGLKPEASSKKHRRNHFSSSSGSLLDLLNMFASSDSPLFPRNVSILKNKLPSLKNGKYFLNFNGRVRCGSLKNFQLQTGESDGVICQFGKVEKDDFHLDFAHPLTPMQAFAIALCQFNL
jgi:hypothetical protein